MRERFVIHIDIFLVAVSPTVAQILICFEIELERSGSVRLDLVDRSVASSDDVTAQEELPLEYEFIRISKRMDITHGKRCRIIRIREDTDHLTLLLDIKVDRVRITICINDTLTDAAARTCLAAFEVGLMDPLVISVIIFEVRTSRNALEEVNARLVARENSLSIKTDILPRTEDLTCLTRERLKVGQLSVIVFAVPRSRIVDDLALVLYRLTFLDVELVVRESPANDRRMDHVRLDIIEHISPVGHRENIESVLIAEVQEHVAYRESLNDDAVDTAALH